MIVAEAYTVQGERWKCRFESNRVYGTERAEVGSDKGENVRWGKSEILLSLYDYSRYLSPPST
jgi:hypothetical protein